MTQEFNGRFVFIHANNMKITVRDIIQFLPQVRHYLKRKRLKKKCNCQLYYSKILLAISHEENQISSNPLILQLIFEFFENNQQ